VLPVSSWKLPIRGVVEMAKFTDGFSCPICQTIEKKESCPQHPNLLMDLYLVQPYTPSQADGQPWRLYRWTADCKEADLVCAMPGATPLDLHNAGRIGVALSACREISTKALQRGYIQTLLQLPLLVADHLSHPTVATQERLKKQVALIQSRGRANDGPYRDGHNNQSGKTDFDLTLAQEWHTSLWGEITSSLQEDGFVVEDRSSFSKQLDGERVGIVNLYEFYAKDTLRVVADIGIYHETLVVKTMQELTAYPRGACAHQTQVSLEESLEFVFSDDDPKLIESFVTAVKKSAQEFFNHYIDLHSVCLKLADGGARDGNVFPIVQTLLGNRRDARECAKAWLKRWSPYPKNTAYVEHYFKVFIPGLKKLESISK
jgi:hypothetical protein